MDFDEALAFLDAHLNREQSPVIAGRVEGFSLDVVRRLVDILGDPQRAYPVIHLTGTNGKGSTARMVTALVAAHELSVGTYTSPHLEHITERLARNLDPIPLDDLARVVGEIASLEPLLLEETAGVAPSYFELLVAAAFSWFAEIAVDVAVVEVGLLGRYDATNVADATVAVVTNVGKDHTNGEGDWRARIAEEKAGIVKGGSSLVLGEPDPQLRPYFEAEGPAEIWTRDRDFAAERERMAIGGRVVDLRAPRHRYEDVFLPFHGAHQADNAACAVAAVEAFFDRALDPDLVASVFAALQLPGRFEVLHRGPALVLDGAHNPDGARSVARTLDEEFDIAGRRRWVLGMMRGRDVDEMLRGFDVRAGDVVVACNPDTPRALPAAEVARHADALGAKAEAIPSVDEAVAHAWTDAAAAGEGDLVMVTGSLYTVGAARTAARRLGLL